MWKKDITDKLKTASEQKHKRMEEAAKRSRAKKDEKIKAAAAKRKPVQKKAGGGKMTDVGLSPAEASRSGVLSEKKRRRYSGGGGVQKPKGYGAAIKGW